MTAKPVRSGAAGLPRAHGARVAIAVDGVPASFLGDVETRIATVDAFLVRAELGTGRPRGSSVFDKKGRVEHRRGVTAVRGLYFLGLPWQHTRGSALLGWVKDDAEYVGSEIAGAATRISEPPAVRTAA